MHICLISQEYPPETNWGGIATYTADMAQALQAAGQQVSVVARSLTGKAYQTNTQGIKVYRIVPAWARFYPKPGFRHIYRHYDAYPWAVYQMLQKIHAQKPIDIIETPNLHGEVLFWQLYGPSVPVVVRLHSSSAHNRRLNGQKNNLTSRIDFWHEKKALSRAVGISAVSQCIVTYNQAILPATAPCQVIGNPLNLEGLISSAAPAKQPFKILYAGRLSSRKGLPTLIEAIPKILEAHPEAHFTLAGADGPGPKGGSMQAWAQHKLGAYQKQVTFTGSLSRPEVIEHFKEAEVVVFPTQFEPFGYITAETMATGGIIVASNLDGPAEIIEHNTTGLLFTPGDPEDLARQVNRVFQPGFPKAAMQAAALKTVQERYQPAVIARQALDFYQTLTST